MRYLAYISILLTLASVSTSSAQTSAPAAETPGAEGLFPVSRAPTPPIAVSELGTAPQQPSGTAHLVVTAAYGLGDLNIYDRDVQTAYPFSGIHFPKDSLTASRYTRAAEWLARIHEHRLLARVLYADLEVEAAHDQLARHLYDSLLTAFAQSPVEQSYVLAEAVNHFADPTQDDTLLARRVTMAEAYLAKFAALPVTHYRTQHDSIGAIDRYYESQSSVALAEAHLGHTAIMLSTAYSALRTLTRYNDAGQKFSALKDVFPYEAVYLELLGEPDGVARIDSLRLRMFAVCTPSKMELAAISDVGERVNLAQSIQHGVENLIRYSAVFGRPAPAVLAHAWLNTPDSLYAPQPRSQALADGQIHVLLVGDNVSALLGTVRHLRARFPDGVAITLVARTHGAIGEALVDPPDEVAWDRQMYEQFVHLTIPVALWAGAKQPAKYDGATPAGSPNYEALQMYPNPGMTAMLVDGHGLIRGRMDSDSWYHEAKLERAVMYLRTEDAKDVGTTTRPPEIISLSGIAALTAAGHGPSSSTVGH